MLDGDIASEWRTPTGSRLHNPGSWTFETHFMAPGFPSAGPYWPGGAIALDDEGPPRLERLLADLSPAELGQRSITH